METPEFISTEISQDSINFIRRASDKASAIGNEISSPGNSTNNPEQHVNKVLKPESVGSLSPQTKMIDKETVVSAKSKSQTDSSSISEQIEKIENAGESLSEQYSNQIHEVSIPSLNLLSLTRTDSEYEDSYANSGPVGSKCSTSTLQGNCSDNEEDPGKSADAESKKSSSNLSWKIDGPNENENISNESSIHTQFDWTDISNSSKNISLPNSPQEDAKEKSSTSSSRKQKRSPRRISQLYPDALATDPPLQNNNDLKLKNVQKSSSSSEEVVKLDIRGHASASRQFPFVSKIFFPSVESIPTPVRENDFIALNEKVVNLTSLQSGLPLVSPSKNLSGNESFNPTHKTSSNFVEKVKNNDVEYEQDYAVEELILNESRDRFPCKDKEENVYNMNIPNKLAAEGGESSLSTVATDYKTLCDDFNHKMPDFQTALTQRENLIDELKASLKQAAEEREQLQYQNEHLTSELGKMQLLLSDANSLGSEMKAHLSDFVKHENFMKESETECFPLTIKLYEKPCDCLHETNDKKSVNIAEMDALPENIKSVEDMRNFCNLTNSFRPSDQFLSDYDNFFEELKPHQTDPELKSNEKLLKMLEKELQNKSEMIFSYSKNIVERINCDRNLLETEANRLRELLFSVKSNNPSILDLRKELEVKYSHDMENLRTYFQKKCSDIEKHYSDEVFSQQSKKMSVDSSMDSLNNCPEAMPFGSPFHSAGDRVEQSRKKLERSHSAEFYLGAIHEPSYFEEKMKCMKAEHKDQIKILTSQHDSYIRDLISSHETYVARIENDYKEQIAELKAHLQTLENTEIHGDLLQFEHRDTDLELEKDSEEMVAEDNANLDNQEILEKTQTLQTESEALLSDPNAEITNWPLELIALRDKQQADAQLMLEQQKMTHAEELSALREENTKQIAVITDKYKTETEKWKQKRNDAFDKNRCLAETIKERDGLKHMTRTLQKVLSQLVEYFNLCEDELNNTFVGELLKQIILADENFDNTIVLSSFSAAKVDPNSSSIVSKDFDPNASTLSQIDTNYKRMHFAPNVNGIMTFIDTDTILDCLDQSQDISINFKHDLDTCLKRLRMEAQELLVMSSSRIASNRLSITGPNNDENVPKVSIDKNESISEKNIDCGDTKSVGPSFDELQEMYKASELGRKELEESLTQSMYHEEVLRQELQLAMDRIGELMADNPLDHTREIISEGYGIVTHPRTPISLPPHPRLAITSPPPILASEGNTPEGRSLSLDGGTDKRLSEIQELARRLTCELEAATREKEDKHMQLEAANKQLKCTRQFLEEQAAEREQERDDFQRQLHQLKDDKNKLTSKVHQHANMCKESETTPSAIPHPQVYVEQLDTQMREMSSHISDLEAQKHTTETELASSLEKIVMLRDIIANVEYKLETKTCSEVQTLKELDSYKLLVEEKELKMNTLTQELESLKKQLADKIAEEVLAAGHDGHVENFDLEMEKKLVDQMRSQLHSLVDTIAAQTAALENLHEAVCSQSCSSPSEDVSVRDHRKQEEMVNEDLHRVTSTSPTKLALELPILEMSQLGDSVHRHFRAEDAAVKRIRDLEMQLVKLKNVAQELRTERDALHERMSEQSMRISFLQSKLEQTLYTADALRHQSAEDHQLDEARSEVQLLKEALDSRDKQVARLKALVESTKKRLVDQEQEITSCTGSSKETIQRLRRDLREQQSKVRELQETLEANRLHHESIPGFLESVVADKNADIDILRQQLLEKEKHLQAVLSIRLDEEVLKHLSNSEKDVNNDGKLSARTLSDILSISEFDEPDVIRKADLCRPQSFLSGHSVISANNIKDQNITQLPEHGELLLGASTALQTTDAYDKSPHLPQDVSPESEKQHTIPDLESSSLLKDNEGLLDKYKRNVNETIPFGLSLNVDKFSTLDGDSENKMMSNVLSDNCSMFPNKDASGDKDTSVEPKRIDFSLVNSSDDVNKDTRKLKGEDSVSASHIENHVSMVAEKSNLEESEKDKIMSLKDLGIQVDLEQKVFPDILTQLKHEICILKDELESRKEDLKLAEDQLSEFPAVKGEVDELKCVLQNSLQTMQEDKQYYSDQLDNFVAGEKILKQKLEEVILDSNEKAKELKTLKEDIVRRENIVLELAKEKRNLQRQLSETEEKCQLLSANENMLQNNSIENMHLKEKSNELQKVLAEKNLQIDNLNENLDQLDDLQRQLNEKNEKVDLLEKESRLLRESENQLHRNNSDLIFEIKKLTEKNLEIQSENSKIKDNLSKLEHELENSSHLEQSLLQKNLLDAHVEGVQMLEEFNSLLREYDYLDSPAGESRELSPEQWSLEKIRKRISSLNYHLNEKRSTINLKVMQLERAKLELNDAKMEVEQLKSYVAKKDSDLNAVLLERNELQERYRNVMDKLREEGNMDELHDKLVRKSEEFAELEGEVASLREEIQRSHHDSLSDRERDNRLKEVSIENGRLKQQLLTLEGKLAEKENLIIELNTVRENLITDLDALEQNSEVEKDTSARLQLLLDTEKQMSNNIQCQDSNVIQILRGRLEVALDSESELKMLLEREKLNCEQLQKHLDKMKKQLDNMKAMSGSDEVTTDVGMGLQAKLENANAQIEDQNEITELLKSEVMLLKVKFDREKGRLVDLQNVLDREKLWFQKEIDASKEQVKTSKGELAEMKRQTHDMHLELVHSRERLHLQKNEISNLEKKLSLLQESQRGVDKSDSYKILLYELEQQKIELNAENVSLKQRLEMAGEREKKLQALIAADGNISDKGIEDQDTVHHLKEMQNLLRQHMTENVHMSETMKELTQERRDLQSKLQQLQDQIKLGGKHSLSMANLPEGVDQQVRFLYGRYMRMDSYRKALLWQKRYLMGVAAALDQWRTRLGDPGRPFRSKGWKRFKCVALTITAVFRMKFLVRRWHTGNRIGANIHLNIPNIFPTELRTSKSYSHVPTSSGYHPKFEARGRHSLNNPSSVHRVPTALPLSWSIGSAVNINQTQERLANRHAFVRHPVPLMSTQSTDVPYRTTPAYRESYGMYDMPDQWHMADQWQTADSPRLRESHSDMPELHADDHIYSPRSIKSDHEASSPIFSQYMDRVEQLNITLQRALNTPRDPP